MSHYVVAVFADDRDFDKLLKPYDEQNEDYYEECQASVETKNWHKKNYNEAVANGSFVGTFEEYVSDRGYTMRDDDLYYQANPNALYDYYSIDGKDYVFWDLLRDKRIRHPRLHDYKFERTPSKRTITNLKKDWQDICRFAEMSDEEFENNRDSYRHFYNPKYLKERYLNEEQYIKEMTVSCPYCYISPDGKLHAPGQMGWFACDDSTADSFNRYYDEWLEFIRSDANPYVSFVDCHI